MNDPAFVPVAELIARYERGELSPVDVVRDVLDRIDRHNGVVNAYCYLDQKSALKSAEESETRWRACTPKGRLDGIPVGIKDNLLVAGMPARYGSRLTTDTPAVQDAPAVARLREQGAIILGKTTMPEFGWKAVGDSPLTGIARNPWDTRKTPGGSSAGAAAAAVLGMGHLQLGTDGGGSIRIPASFTGCYGVKPTRTFVPVWPAAPLGTLAHTGVLTRSVADAALTLAVIARPDTRDVYASPSPPPDFEGPLNAGVSGMRMAYSPRLGFVRRVEPEIEAAVAAAARVFEGLGAQVEKADPQLGADPVDAWSTLWWSSFAALLAPYGGRVQDVCDPGMVAGATLGGKIPATDYIRAQLKRAELHIAMARFFERYDILLTPTLPLAAFDAGHLTPPDNGWGEAWMDWAPFSYPFNLTQQPAASIPCASTRDGLPIGLQIVGTVGADATVLRASRAFEQVRPFSGLEAPRVR